jgi:tetratricopeptide (TPR) repeat protein
MVVVDFFQVDGGAAAAFDKLVQVEHDFGPKGVAILGVGIDQKNNALANLLRKKPEVDWPIAFDGVGFMSNVALNWKASRKVGLAFHDRPKIPAAALSDDDFAAAVKDADDKLKAAGDAALAEIDPLVANGDYAGAVSKLGDLEKSADGTTLATEARQKRVVLEKDPEVRKKLAAAPSGSRSPATSPTTVPSDASSGRSRAKGLLSLAENYRDNGNFDTARAKYQDVITQFPGTPEAQTAKEELDKLSS